MGERVETSTGTETQINLDGRQEMNNQLRWAQVLWEKQLSDGSSRQTETLSSWESPRSEGKEWGPPILPFKSSVPQCKSPDTPWSLPCGPQQVNKRWSSAFGPKGEYLSCPEFLSSNYKPAIKARPHVLHQAGFTRTVMVRKCHEVCGRQNSWFRQWTRER